ncbi:MAG TPA: hypothetical protein DEG43_08895 [Acidimicrobiaceae bacterium]|nr:hypothetical protein [Acidimicrobiaceae bacterium]
MKFNRVSGDPAAIPCRDAATIMWLRSTSATGLEVLMLRRNLQSDFVGGAYVFPGGAVDPEDAMVGTDSRVHGRSDSECSMKLGLAAGGSAFWVAAIRESFEEAGLLAARHATGESLSFSDPDTAATFVEDRKKVDVGSLSMAELCAAHDLSLELDRIHYFSRWITPLGAPRRYDTRFFVGLAPESQEPLHDDHEVIANEWVTPTEALARHEAGDFDLVFPTVRSLESLCRFDNAEDVLSHARRIDQVEAVIPVIEDSPHGVRILLPGDRVFDAATSRPILD